MTSPDRASGGPAGTVPGRAATSPDAGGPGPGPVAGVVAGGARLLRRSGSVPVATMLPARERSRDRVRWIPRQHGAWALLAVPFVLGVVASRPTPWQGLLAVAAVSAYLASSALLDWTRSRRGAYLQPAFAFGTLFAMAGLALIVVAPALARLAVVAAAAAAVALGASLAGHPRSLVASLAQVAQALVLVPAAALVAGSFDSTTVARATLVAGGYLVSSVLVVRSMIRARGDRTFLTLSIGYHVAAALTAAWLLPAAYAVLALALAARAVILPALQVRLAEGPHRLRPIHLGMVEIAASLALVAAVLVARF